jgi:hypothetical protein
MRALGSLFALALYASCTPDFTQQWEVEHTRVLAARVDIDGDATERTRPMLGDTFSMRIFMATAREPKTPLESRFDAKLELCLGILLPDGSLACSALPGQPASVTFGGAPIVVSDDELRFNGLTVPSELDMAPPPFDEIDRIALFGAVCAEGKVERVADKQVNEDPVTELFRCTDNAASDWKEPLVFTTSVLLDRGKPGHDNHHPSFACGASAAATDACKAGIEVPGEEPIAGEFILVRPEKGKGIPRETQVWGPRPDGALPWTGCADSGLPTVRLGDKEHTIRVRFDAADREQYQSLMEVEGKEVLESAREELRVAHAISEFGGDLARHFSILEQAVPDSEAEIEVAYTPPGVKGEAAEGLTAAGRLVRVYFTLRDERGGVDYITRELCLLPK